MHLSRTLLSLFSLLGIGTTFLPWQLTTVLGETTAIKGTETSILLQSIQMGDGWLCVISFSLVLILAILGKRQLPISIGKKVLNILLGGFCVFVGISDSVKMKSMSVVLPDSPLSMITKPGYGLYLLIAASALIILISLIPFRKRVA